LPNAEVSRNRHSGQAACVAVPCICQSSICTLDTRVAATVASVPAQMATAAASVKETRAFIG
jgi:hypothetical protein